MRAARAERRARQRNAAARAWLEEPCSVIHQHRVVEAIVRRRRQMLVHSFLYYKLDSPIISDHLWSKWAQQLYLLQKKYGYVFGFYDEVFRDWDGSSGFHLPADDNIMRVARRVHDYYQEQRAAQVRKVIG